MNIGLDTVIVACVVANLAGLGATALVSRRGRSMPIGPGLLSFVVGVLIGAVLLDLLPHLWEATGSLASLLGMLGAALGASALFDRTCLCRHDATELTGEPDGHRHGAAQGRSTRGAGLLWVGDFVHSLIDGALIVAAFSLGNVPGAVAVMAVGIHEVPRRIATVALLLRAGCKTGPAFGLAVCAGIGTVLGGVTTWWSAEMMRSALPMALALAAAAMLYVAAAQSAQLFSALRTRILSIECGLPFVAGVSIIGGSHHALHWFG